MDPLSIAAASVSLAASTLKISHTLWECIESIVEVDLTIRTVHNDLVCLSESVNAIGRTCEHPVIALAIVGSKAEYDGTLWKNLAKLLSNCRNTIR